MELHNVKTTTEKIVAYMAISGLGRIPEPVPDP